MRNAFEVTLKKILHTCTSHLTKKKKKSDKWFNKQYCQQKVNNC